MPFTERATNVAKLIRFVARFGFLSGFRWLQSVLKKPEHYCELQELQAVSSLQEHFFTRLRDLTPVLIKRFYFCACSPSFLAISRAVFLSRSIMERNSEGETY